MTLPALKKSPCINHLITFSLNCHPEVHEHADRGELRNKDAQRAKHSPEGLWERCTKYLCGNTDSRYSTTYAIAASLPEAERLSILRQIPAGNFATGSTCIFL